MANYDIDTNHVYNNNIRKLENSDPANAETIFNPLFSQIINNVNSIKNELDNLEVDVDEDEIKDLINANKTEVIDNLNSTSDTSALSANQGRILSEAIASSSSSGDQCARYEGGTNSFVVGNNNTISGNYSGNIGYKNTSSQNYSHVLGSNSTSSSTGATTVGNYCTTSGSSSSTFGYGSSATGQESIAVGFWCQATGTWSTCVGQGSVPLNYQVASGTYSTAIGYQNSASGDKSSAVGCFSSAKGSESSAFGYRSYANSWGATTTGYAVTSDTAQCMVVGKYNTTTQGSSDSYEATADGFVVGIGTGYGTDIYKNGLRITNSGLVYGGTYYNSGADYAEYFEWFDGNIENQDRIGRFVCVKEGKIKLAESWEDNIIGAISGGTCSIIGDAQADEWHGKYSRDIFGRLEYEWIDVEHEKVTGVDDDGNEITEKEIKQEYHMKLNPNYDPDTPYTPRSDRQEWDVVGLLGKLILIDDGTCQIGDYCTASIDGIATKTNSLDGFMVLERLDESHIKILKL